MPLAIYTPREAMAEPRQDNLIVVARDWRPSGELGERMAGWCTGAPITSDPERDPTAHLNAVLASHGWQPEPEWACDVQRGEWMVTVHCTHLPGRPADPVGPDRLTHLAQRVWAACLTTRGAAPSDSVETPLAAVSVHVPGRSLELSNFVLTELDAAGLATQPDPPDRPWVVLGEKVLTDHAARFSAAILRLADHCQHHSTRQQAVKIRLAAQRRDRLLQETDGVIDQILARVAGRFLGAARRSAEQATAVLRALHPGMVSYGEKVLHARLRLAQARLAQTAGEYPEAFRQAAEAARLAGNPGLLSDAHAAWAMAVADLGAREIAVAELEEVQQARARRGDHAALAVGRIQLARLRRLCGHVPAALVLAQAAVAWLIRQGPSPDLVAAYSELVIAAARMTPSYELPRVLREALPVYQAYAEIRARRPHLPLAHPDSEVPAPAASVASSPLAHPADLVTDSGVEPSGDAAASSASGGAR